MDLLEILREERRTRRWTGKEGRRDARRLLREVETALLARREAAWRDTPEGTRLEVLERSWMAGRFSTPSLDSLSPASPREGRVTLSALVGADPLTDIGTLQAMLGAGALFQVASQFNALEAPSSGGLVPVSRYPSDPTQGPRASVGAFPGTFLRHHRLPHPVRGSVDQSDGPQIDLLVDVTGPGLARVTNGYLLRRNIEDGEAFLGRLEGRFDSLRVGLQEGVEVVLGHAWGGPVPDPPIRIHQVLTSTVALGMYDSHRDVRRVPDPLVEGIARQLLRGAYLGTLLAAARVGAPRVVLTWIGGGVFGNAIAWIRDAVLWACAEAERRGAGDLDVWVNARDPAPGWTLEELGEDTAARGGRTLLVGVDPIRVLGA